MINQIKIKGFQSHIDTELHLFHGVNIIIGPSDNGKSAIVRALDWVINNEPSGDSFRNKNSKTTSVILTLDDGTVIERLKTNTKNIYRINDTEYSGFGQTVPQEVKEALNLSDINYQTQGEPHFLLVNSPGEVAKKLNEIVNLEQIDSSHLNINHTVREVERKLKETKESYEIEKEKLAQFIWINEADEILKLVEDILDKQTILENKIVGLFELAEQLEVSQDTLSYYKDLDVIKAKVFSAESVVLEGLELEEQIDSLDYLIDEINNSNKILEQFESLDSLKLTINSISSIVDERLYLSEYTTSLKFLCDEIESGTIRINSLSKNVGLLKDELELIMPEICPFCGALIE